MIPVLTLFVCVCLAAGATFLLVIITLAVIAKRYHDLLNNPMYGRVHVFEYKPDVETVRTDFDIIPSYNEEFDQKKLRYQLALRLADSLVEKNLVSIQATRDDRNPLRDVMNVRAKVEVVAPQDYSRYEKARDGFQLFSRTIPHPRYR